MQASATNIVSLAEYRRAREKERVRQDNRQESAPSWGQFVIVWVPVWMYPVGYVPTVPSVQIRP